MVADHDDSTGPPPVKIVKELPPPKSQHKALRKDPDAETMCITPL